MTSDTTPPNENTTHEEECMYRQSVHEISSNGPNMYTNFSSLKREALLSDFLSILVMKTDLLVSASDMLIDKSVHVAWKRE